MKSFATSLSHRHPLLEQLLVAVVLGMTALMWSYSVDDTVLLHVFYVPVVLTGFFLGGYRARLMSLLCVLTATIIFVPYLAGTAKEPLSLSTLVVFSLWAATLVLIAVLVGTLSDGWRSSLAALKKAHQKDLFTDSLTGVANRRAYEYELSRRLADSERNLTPLTLVLIDIDHFKKFNDRYGHAAGDAVLRAVAQSLGETLRQTDLVARYGGEEFVVLLPGIDIDEAREVAERIRSLIETSRFPYNDLKLRLTVSLGAAHRMAGEVADSLAQRADAAMYSSKQAGRNCAHYHDGDHCRQFGAGIATDVASTYWANPETVRATDNYTDEASGLPTQKVFLEELRRRVAERSRYDTQLALAIVEFDADVGGLGHDSHAHTSRVATIAKLASSVLRDTELIARFDSNRLAILLPATSLEAALVPLQRLSKFAAKHNDVKYASLSYAVNIGAIELAAGEHPGSALQRVESALAMARAGQHDRVCIHDGSECRAVEAVETGVETAER